MTLRLGDTLIAGSGANTDLSNLTSQGQNIANWSTNVTNCITEIPQDIKLELNNGTLTLKAGSKVYVPKGFEQDGTTPRFDVVTIENDITCKFTSNAQNMLFVNPSSGGMTCCQVAYCYSGTTAPSGSTFMFWYDTANNLLKTTSNNGSTWSSGRSLPLCLNTSNGTSIVSIDQVFNGFGYIGSTVFALPGVKGLIPNGRNTDGSLKNIEFTTSSVLTKTQSWNYDWVVCTLYKSNDSIFIAAYGDKDLTFDENKNLFFFNGGVVAVCPFTKYRMQNGISNFTPKTAFHALDYNDSSTISGWSMPSGRYIDLTLLASGSQYTAPANGWFYFSKNGTAGGQFAVFEAASDGIAGEISGVSYNAGYVINLLRPVKKGITVKLRYTAQGATNYFRFVYGEGENV